jgi:type II secretory pathway pseudopilin PulG
MKNILRHSQNGSTLIELTLFILILGIILATFFKGFTTTQINEPKILFSSEAIELAQQRMEIIVGNRKIQGFSAFIDPCAGGSPPPLCTVSSGYTVTSTIQANYLGNVNYKLITVNVAGNSNKTLNLLVTNY